MRVRFGLSGTIGRGALFGALTLVASGMAQADQASFCRDYASRAAQQQVENLEKGCGFQGPRWTSNGGAAYAWCMAAGRAAADMETAIRDKNLGRCQSGGWPGGADNGGGAELITIPTGMAGPGVNCVPERRAKGQGGTMDAAIQDARRNWERLVARRHGGEYAHSEKAVEAEFRCVQQRGSASCELIGTPCRGPGGGAGGDQGQPANSREFPAGTQAQMAECKPEMRAAGAGNAYNIAGARARQAWEQSVKSLYGNRYANLDNAHAAKYSCAPGNGGVICEAIGLPCRP